MDFIDEFLNKEDITLEDMQKLEEYTRELEKNLTENELNNLVKSKIHKQKDEQQDYMRQWLQMSDKEKIKETKRKVKKFKKMQICKGLKLIDVTIRLK